jgi:glycosyltransferase involved in cell wall biosynthesis
MSAGLHVLFVPSWYPRDEEDASVPFIREQAIALQQSGDYRVGVIHPHYSKRATGTTCAIEAGIPTLRSRLPFWLSRVPQISARYWVGAGERLFRQYVADYGLPDLLHAHVILYGGLLAHALGNRYGIPYVITEHNSGYRRGLVKPWQLSLARKAAAGARNRMAVSQSYADYLSTLFAQPHAPWCYVPNAVSQEFFDCPLKQLPRRRSFRFHMLCNLNQNKDVGLAIGAVERLLRGGHSLRLCIGGEGPERPRLMRLVRERGLQQNIRFLGPLSREGAVKFISLCDALLLSSRYETFGMVLAEALALGKPVVSTRCGGPESIVSSGDGVLVEPQSETALADGMLRVMARPETFHGEDLRRSCASRFSKEVFLANMDRAYHGALHGGERVGLG